MRICKSCWPPVTFLALFLVGVLVMPSCDSKSSSSSMPPSGIVIDSSSTVSFSAGSMKATNQTNSSCWAISFVANNNSDSQGYFVVAWGGVPGPRLNQPYPASQSNPSGPDVDGFGIDSSQRDIISQASLTFYNITGNLAFAFSITYEDGKVLAGTVNVPMNTNTTCRGPVP